MNIHEHQAKKIFKQFGIPVPQGIALLDLKKIKKKNSRFKFYKKFSPKSPDPCWGQRQGGWYKINKKY